MFISNVVLSWEPSLESVGVTVGNGDLPYTYLRHSEELLRYTSDNRHFLIDVISNLKRAVNHRTNHLSINYKIKKTSCYAKHKNIWYTLVELDVIKPVMLNKLTEIRNAIEHKFSDPPPQTRCVELAEFVWYFLKSTDQLANQMSEGPFLSESFDSPYAIRYDGIPENDWKSSISARLPAELVSAHPKTDWFEISEDTIQSDQDYNAVLLQNSNMWKDDDVIVTGKLNDKDVESWFLKLYFRIT